MAEGREGIVGGTEIGDFAARYGVLDKKTFLEEQNRPFLVVEVPTPRQPAGLKRTFKTLNVGADTRPKPKEVVRVVFAVTKRGADNPSLVTVGRTRAADICLDDVSISKLHAYFTQDPVKGTYMIADAGSTNGTTLKGKKLGFRKPVPLKGGEAIEFGGRFRAQFLLPAALYKLLRKL